MVQPNGEPIHCIRNYDGDHKISPRYFCVATRRIGDIILNPPAEKPYTALRDRLCSQYDDSEEQRLRDLISGMQLGDRKPSRLLLEMRSKAGNRMPKELLKSLFLQRLPTYVQQILAISNDRLEKLAEMADGIMAATSHTS
ncbi:uncharacterized protein NPIL_174711 [Nephila pilipes]|uniref:Uncharacterized protein n=1 Tax=Nephila pilipes TaxID=299642 RepID=A0A8X6NCA4_NEPPI|nr:uncharacterized protein NPIL_174711 [Nephila pilipes]